MVYVISLFYVITAIFTYLAVSTFFLLNQARMYPPKQMLRKKIGIYLSGALICFLIAWCLQYI
jgi:hypothetical protein